MQKKAETSFHNPRVKECLHSIIGRTDICSVRFVKFCCVGFANTGIDFLTFALLVHLGFSAYLSRVASWVIGTAFSFLVNRTWTFKTNDAIAGSLFRFLVVNGATLGTSLFLLYVFKRLGLSDIPAYLVSLPFTILCSYAGYRFWAFKTIGK